MIAAAALAAGLAVVPPEARAYAPTRAQARAQARVLLDSRAAAGAPAQAWTLQALGWIDAGLRLCTQARTPAGLDAAAFASGARRAAAPAVDLRFATPVWLLGPRGEVQVSASRVRDGLRCMVSAASGDASALAAELPRRVAALGYVRAPTLPARWPGEGAWRGRAGLATGGYLATAAPFVHAAPYGALLVVSRPAAR